MHLAQDPQPPFLSYEEAPCGQGSHCHIMSQQQVDTASKTPKAVAQVFQFLIANVFSS